MVYLIHFERPLHRAQHYLGYTRDECFESRINCHRNERGSCLLRAVNSAGITWEVVRKWPGKDGNFERQLKNRKKGAAIMSGVPGKIKTG
jgi:predicted GIY-YIG superfamily endonuclease